MTQAWTYIIVEIDDGSKKNAHCWCSVITEVPQSSLRMPAHSFSKSFKAIYVQLSSRHTTLSF